MSEIPRWTIDDLLARYDLEPELLDVFVEGSFDQEILTLWFDQNSMAENRAYVIDSVEIPSALLKKHGLTNGNKQRVMALALELGVSLKSTCQFRCLVDKDLDHWFGAILTHPRLLWTDYCSIELYFYDDNLLRNILLTAAKCRISDWQQFWVSFTSVLRQLYTLRLSDRELSWSMTWIATEKCLQVKSTSVEFDIVEYTKRVLMRNNKIASIREFSQRNDAWSRIAVGDPRYCIRGHDMLELAAWTIRHFSGLKELASTTAVERLLILQTEKSENCIHQFSKVIP